MEKLKILYVEDEPDIRSIAKIALESLGGFEVHECGSGKEAIKNAPVIAPDLFLLDVMMPAMNGLETLERLRLIPQLADTAVIFMTAKVQEREIRHYIEQGALGVIIKPFDPLTLSDEILAMLQVA